MEAKRDFTSWRQWLGQLSKHSQDKQRLAHEASVQPVTIKRWVTGESHPREENIRQLVRSLPKDISAPFWHLVEAEFPSFVHEDFASEPLVAEISSSLYARIMQAYARTSPALARDTLYKLIFDAALTQLDPEKLGMSLVLVGCVPPRENQKVRALRQLRGMGNPPWERDLEKRTMFLGSESVAGSAVMNYRVAGVESRDATSFTPANWTDYEQSAIASPVLRQARVAGALLASSAQSHYFTSAHQTLLDLYAHLALVLFEPDEFYNPSEIMLGVMPPLGLQTPYFASFEQRFSLKFAEAEVRKSSMNFQQIHLSVWQDIAEELLQVRDES
jgi:hypothetical protein